MAPAAAAAAGAAVERGPSPASSLAPGAATLVHPAADRAGAPLSAPVGTPPMDVIRPRRTNIIMSSSGSNQPQVRDEKKVQLLSRSLSGFHMRAFVGDEKKVQLLSRSLSGSKLNAKAPEFVPKGLAAFSTSLPGPIVQGLGFSPPTLVSVPSSVIPVIVPSPVVNVVLSPAVEEILVESPPSVDGVHPNDTTEGLDLVLGQDLTGESEHSHAPAAAAVTQVVKPVVTEELKAKIVKQVEFYFSDTNLPTDNYLMKFVKKDPEGFVPIPVVASFRKIKNLVKNHGVVAAALRNSSRLVVSDDGKKVRRVHPLPDVDLEEVQARTVVAENLPEDHSIESMEQLFSKVGTVKMVRICHPEAANGANQTAAKHPKTDMIVSNKLHALVEYETVELADKAVAELTDERNWRSGLRVRLLLRRQFQSKHSYQQAPHQRGRKPSGDGTELGFEEEESVSEKIGERSEKNGDDITGMHHHVDRSDDVLGCEAGDGGNKKGRGRGRGGRTGGRGRGQQYHTHSGTPPQSSLHLASEIVGKPPPGPRMPDGTRGFSTGRGKLLAVNNAVNTLA